MADDLTPKKLTPKQDTFCQEYLKDLNATQAAIRAGYSEATAQEQSSRLLSNVMVKERVQALMDERKKRTEITADYVLTKIQETVERCSQAVPVFEWNPDSKAMERTGEWKFEHTGVLKGCELLGKHLKLFTEKHEHTGKDGQPIEVRAVASLPDEAVQAEIQALLAKQKGQT